MKENKRSWKSKKQNKQLKHDNLYSQLNKELKPEKIVESKEESFEQVELESQIKFREFIEKVKAKLNEDYKQLKTTKFTDFGNKKQKETGQDGLKRYRNFTLQEDFKKEIINLREIISNLQQKNSSMSEEIEKIHKLMKIRQETFIKREKKIKRTDNQIATKVTKLCIFIQRYTKN